MIAPKLTRRQQTLLRKALDRDGLVLVRGASATKIVEPLLTAGLVREVPCSESDIAWRPGCALVLTAAGRMVATLQGSAPGKARDTAL